MKVLLQNGLFHTLVVDADSKFLSIFKHSFQRMKMNLHVTFGGDHNAILVERFKVFMNKGLCIFCPERDIARCFEECS